MMNYQTWCQLALLAFPRDYRRRRGAEMLATLLDGAQPDHTRPSVRELLTIVAGGWRCRLRLRPGAGALILATCSALTATILGGVAAAWLAWALAAPELPSNAEAEAIAQAVVGTEPSEVRRAPVPYHLDFDGEDLNGIQFRFHQEGRELSPPAEVARQRLNLEGWSVARFDTYSSIEVQTPTGPVRYGESYSLVAYRADLRMTVEPTGTYDGSTWTVWLDINHAEPPLVLTATIAGAIVCGLGGWLLNARLGRRCAGRPAFMAGVLAVGILTIEAFLPLCFYALVAFIGGYVDGGQPEPVWWPLGGFRCGSSLPQAPSRPLPCSSRACCPHLRWVSRGADTHRLPSSE